MSGTYAMQPIAHIRSDFGSKFGVPRQSGLVDALTAAVVFEEPYRNPDALRGLEDFIVINTHDVLMICPRDMDKLKDFLSSLAMPDFEEYR